ncbi:MAG: hypothetical protein QM729_11600 [Solirubrobacterales bacterium]
MWRWPAADPREVVDLAGAGATAVGNSEASLGEELRRWRGIVARRRVVVLARRDGALALGLAALLEVLAQFGLLPQWVVVAVPLAAFLVAVAWFVAHGPSPFELARLLDDKLGLNDRLATALEIEARGGAESFLERRTVADAAALLAAGREDWRASAGRAGREWWALAAPVAALLIVVAIGAAAGGSSAGPTEALAPKAGAGGSSAERKKAEEKKKNESHAAPTGKLHKFKGKKVPASQIAAEESKEGYQKIPQGSTSSGKEADGKNGSEGKGGSKAKNIEKAAEGKAGANENRAGNKAGSGSKAQNEAEHPTVGFNVKSQKSGGNHGRPGNSEVGGNGAKKNAPNGQGDETSASANGKKSAPTGTNHAGGEQGNNQQGHVTAINSKAASQGVKIQPGYAPSRASKSGKEKKKTGYSQGAGGKARTATVTGGTQVGDEFSYVPAAGGALPGASLRAAAELPRIAQVGREAAVVRFAT